MTIKAPFMPAYTQGQTVTPAAGSAAVASGVGQAQIVFSHLSGNVTYVRTGPAGVVATAADYPILPGTQVSLSKDIDHTHVAYISPLGSSLHILPGNGF